MAKDKYTICAKFFLYGDARNEERRQWFISEMQRDCFDRDGASGEFELGEADGVVLFVTFTRYLSEDAEYAEELAPGDLNAGLLAQFKREFNGKLPGGNTPAPYEIVSGPTFV